MYINQKNISVIIFTSWKPTLYVEFSASENNVLSTTTFNILSIKTNEPVISEISMVLLLFVSWVLRKKK